jgi:hypothetical protein
MTEVCLGIGLPEPEINGHREVCMVSPFYRIPECRVLLRPVRGLHPVEDVVPGPYRGIIEYPDPFRLDAGDHRYLLIR